MNRSLFFALVAMVAVSSTTAFYFHRENARLRLQMDRMGTQASAAAEPRENEEEATDDATSGAETTEPASLATASAGGDSGAGDHRENSRAQRMAERRDRGREAMARMLTDPAMREVMLTRMKGQVDRQFGDLFVRLGLGEEQTEVLRTLLAERQMVRMQSNFLRRSSVDDERAQREAEAWGERELATIEAGIEAVLGDNGMETLRAYQATATERQLVDNVAQRASYMGAPLDAAASERLVRVINDAAESHPVSSNPALRRSADDAQPLTRQAADEYLGELQSQNRAVLAQAGEFLSESQLEALAAQQLERYEQAAAELDFRLRNPDLGPRGGGFRGPRGRDAR